MKKQYQNRMMTADKPETKVLRCINEQMVPGFGTFTVGETITNPAAIEALKGNPNFVETTEE